MLCHYSGREKIVLEGFKTKDSSGLSNHLMLRINPGNIESFPRLSRKARGFRSFRLQHLSFRFIPARGRKDRVYGLWDCSSTRPRIRSLDDRDAFDIRVNSEIGFVLNIVDCGQKQTRPVAHSDKGFDVFVGTFHFAMSNHKDWHGARLGKLYMKYEVILSDPLPPDAMGIQLFRFNTSSQYDDKSSSSIDSSYERRTDVMLRKLFPHHEFKKVRPDWLLNDYPGHKTPAQPLELDFFCEPLMLAVEAQGQQHRFVVPTFHGTGAQAKRRLWGQQQRDKLKRERCEKRGVDLIEVWFDEDIETVLRNHPFIRKRL